MFLYNILDLVFPPTKEDLLIRSETEASVQRFYIPHRVKKHTALTSYRQPIIKALITANKFQNNRHAARLLASLVKMRLSFYQTNTVIIPIPLSGSRKRERGYNQITQITEQLPDKIANHNITVIPGLIRVRDTTPQSKLPRQDRLENIKSAFGPHRTLQKITNADRVVIIDDVVTTGTTLTEAARTLRGYLPMHCTIETLAIAH